MTERPPTLAARIRALRAQLPYLPRACALVWTATRQWTLLWGALLLLQALLPVAVVYLTRGIVDGLVEAVAAGGSWASVRPTLVLVVLMGGVMLASELAGSATSWVRAAQAELVQDHLHGLIHEQSIALDLAFYETPDYHDRLHRARAEARSRALTLLENAGSLTQNTITLLAMAAVLVPFGLWLPLALGVSTLPALAVALRQSVREHEWRLRRTSDERRAWYYDWWVTSPETAAELRLFGLGRHFQSAFEALRRRLRDERLRLAGDAVVAGVAARTFGLLVTGAALAWMAWKTMRGALSLGDLALFYQAFHHGQRLMHALLQNVGQAYANVLFVGHLFEFLDLEPRLVDPSRPARMPVPLREGIRFDRVTFRYPGRARPALREFSLLIPAGQAVAIVGENGAGKSTLIKLICRLYDPDEGRIELDGVDLRALSLEELRGQIAGLLQEPVRHNATVAENIRLGAVAGMADSRRVESAAAAAGAREVVERLPRGYDTVLGKAFADGTELSGGEWTRIALARTLVREAPIVLLDEPTRGMDPWAEARLADRVFRETRGQTVVVITHRFTTAMRADVIHVMRDGQIVESGSHDDLVARDGEYARSWRRQRRRRHQIA